MSMKIISWNINGIKSLIKTGYFEEIFAEKPDILCLQEVKSAEIPDVENYYSYQSKFLHNYILIYSHQKKALIIVELQFIQKSNLFQ